MIAKSEKIVCRNGHNFEVKTPDTIEAESVLEFMRQASLESPYILSTPDSFKKKTVEGQTLWIEESATHESSVILALYEGSKIIGLCNGRSYSDVKRKHRASLGITLLTPFRGRGLGKKLMEILIQNMKIFKDIQIIELDVMTNNKLAVQMYEKMGFQKVGVFPKAYILLDGEVSDNLQMYMHV